MPLSDKAAGIWQTARAVFPYALTMALFALGLYAVLHLLGDVKLADVIAQVRSTPVLILVLAHLTALAGYLFLVGYDWSGLRYIGKPLPLPVTLTGGLMAYAFGNTSTKRPGIVFLDKVNYVLLSPSPFCYQESIIFGLQVQFYTVLSILCVLQSCLT
jgi:hypothetical protein